MYVLIAVLMSVAALVLFWLAHKQEQAAGLPGGKVIYADTKNWSTVEAPFYDAALGLTGKPDYLVQQGDQIIPVEVKSANASGGPYEGHILQLAAYCLLIERNFRKRPRYGILHYPTRTYRIDYTGDLEAALRERLAEMRAAETSPEIHRSHASAGRCIRCGYRSICPEKLA